MKAVLKPSKAIRAHMNLPVVNLDTAILFFEPRAGLPDTIAER